MFSIKAAAYPSGAPNCTTPFKGSLVPFLTSNCTRSKNLTEPNTLAFFSIGFSTKKMSLCVLPLFICS